MRTTVSTRALALLLILSTSSWTACALRCIKTDMCSLGQLKPYIGNVANSKDLQAAAAARSYKKEIILVMTLPNRILDVKMLMANWAKFGMEHVLLMGNNEETCHVAARELPNVGCVWDPLQVKSISDAGVAWHVRYRTLARLVRMGYNVLVADSDIVVFDDPYRYWKAPPFNKFTIINQPELLYRELTYEGTEKGNGGMIYVQNARPDGVAAWLLAETTDRFLRWMEDGFKLLEAKKVPLYTNSMDQDALNDALSSVATGFPHSYNGVSSLENDQANNPARVKVRDHVADQVFKMWQINDTQLPKFMHRAAGRNTTSLRWLDMVMPHTEGKWPDEFGGRWYPETRGPLSTAFLELLKSDCNGCALWPDVEDPATLQAARAVPREKYLLAPPWLMCGYNAQGSSGAWLPDANGHVPQVVGHGHYMPAALNIHKLIWRQFVDSYDWALAQEHWGTQHVFQANMQQPPGELEVTPYIEDNPSAPRLLVMYSRMRLNKLRSMEEYITVLNGAMQIAALSNRTLVWPDLPCNTSWVGRLDATEGLFTPIHSDHWYPYRGQQPELLCMLVHLIRPQCIIDRRGMLGTEYDYFVKQYGMRYDLQPNQGNTAFFPIRSQLYSSLDTRDGPAPVIVEVAQHDAQSHLDDLEQAQVVFLAHPVKVAGYDMGGWSGCLNPETIERIPEAKSNPASSIKISQGRVVNGRLTTDGGLAPPATQVTREHSAAAANYAGRPVIRREGPAAWCKPAVKAS